MKDAVTIRPARAWVDLLRLREPSLFDHGANWAIEAIIADRLGMPRPRTPQESRREGGRLRGKQLAGKPALNKKEKV